MIELAWNRKSYLHYGSTWFEMPAQESQQRPFDEAQNQIGQYKASTSAQMKNNQPF